jgi:hypothetical protein
MVSVRQKLQAHLSQFTRCVDFTLSYDNSYLGNTSGRYYWEIKCGQLIFLLLLLAVCLFALEAIG